PALARYELLTRRNEIVRKTFCATCRCHRRRENNQPQSAKSAPRTGRIGQSLSLVRAIRADRPSIGQGPKLARAGPDWHALERCAPPHAPRPPAVVVEGSFHWGWPT